MFIVGDKVFDAQYGWGKVTTPILVKFYFNLEISYTIDGRRYADGKLKVLSFKEYDLVNGGFSQKRPELD